MDELGRHLQHRLECSLDLDAAFVANPFPSANNSFWWWHTSMYFVITLKEALAGFASEGGGHDREQADEKDFDPAIAVIVREVQIQP